MERITNEELIKKAYKAMEYAYAPYSQFYVGAAVLTEDNKIFTGCNVENVSYGGTVCAERTAIFKAVSEGHRRILKLAIVSKTHTFTFPCGMCRQVMTEFMNPDGIIVLADDEKGIVEYKLEEMIPYSFSF